MQDDPLGLESGAARAIRAHLSFDEGDRIEDIERIVDAVLVHTTRMSWRATEVSVPSTPGLNLLAVSPNLMSDPPLRSTIFGILKDDVLVLDEPGQLRELWRRLPLQQRASGVASAVLALSYTPTRGATISDLRVNDEEAPVLTFRVDLPGSHGTNWSVELSDEPVITHCT